MKANAFVAIVAAKSTRFLSYILFRFNASSDEIPRKEHSIKTLSDTAKSLQKKYQDNNFTFVSMLLWKPIVGKYNELKNQ